MYTDALQLEEELDKLLYDYGFQVADLVVAGRMPHKVFRVFIDRVDGGRVTIADCSALSRQVTLFLESKGVYTRDCSLELGSAGLDRVLKRPRDFERYLGREVRVTHHTGGKKETLSGELTSFNDEQLLLTPLGPAGPLTSVRSLALADIDRVSLVPQIDMKQAEGSR
jgi:ribosome maturation factor RimP